MVILYILVVFYAIVIGFFAYDFYRKRPVADKVPLSFVIPCYNDGDTIEQTIKGIYDSYDHDLLELIVVNDKSTDNSAENMELLQKKYHFTVINNPENRGKAASINHALEYVQHDIMVVIDADTIINPRALWDMLARFQFDEKVGGVSCYYIPANKWIIPSMLAIEYHMLALIQWAYNVWSTISLRWWCMAVKTAACREVGGYSINAIVEDMDMAFKLNEHGRRVEQSHIGVRSHVPDTFLVWIKQKMRRNSGGFQCFSKHWRVWIKNPIHVLFTFLVNGLFLTMSYGLYKQLLSFEVVRQLFVNLIDIMTLRKSIVLIVGMYAQSILAAFSTKIGYTIFSLPYVFPYMKRRSTLRKVLLVIPFSWIYVPIFSILGVFGMLRGVYRTYELRDGRRAW